MSDPRRLLDVWVVELNTVYRRVPFTVVADWIQQGRLLDDDCCRPAGQGEWVRLADDPMLAAYLPRSDPRRSDDQAEALERVAFEFAYRPREDDDEDVDMIPLIDISLVLLIFFMMTSTVVITGAGIDTPETEFSFVQADPEMIWIGIDRDAAGQPVYSIGQGQAPPDAEDTGLSEEQVLQRLDARLRQHRGQVEVRVAAHRQLPFETVRRMTVHLQRRKPLGISRIYGEVSEKQP
ncbi:MAG: biopolymer transporter ExbD [Gemmataceae bacterium]|nr:biopolymer transporter ExbD [Gemmataceae bacterium]MDW8266835.1 biopolymer transporter ExbD [Gemmataceae bacterium]